jgi:molybdopterin synthase sulfur carrier subunit
MVEVNLWSGLRAFTGGAVKVEVEATTVGEVLTGLAAAHPGLADILEDSVSVVVNGQIVVDSVTEPVPPDAEVWIMKRLRGG